MRGVLAALALCLILFAATSHAQADKVSRLRDFTSSASNGIIKFNTTGFKSFVFTDVRPYNLLILFTATGDKFNCAACVRMAAELQQVANSFREAGAHQPVAQNAKGSDGKKVRPVFFGIIDFADPTVQSIFEQFGFSSVPQLVFLPAGKVLERAGGKISVNKEDTYAVSGSASLDDITAAKLLSFANERTKRQVELYESPLMKFAVLIIVTLVVLVAARLALILRPILLHPMVWFLGSLFVYWVCTAGFVFNLIHDVPFSHVDPRTKQVVYITNRARQQTGAEGYIMGGAIVLGGIAIILLTEVAPRLKSRYAQRLFSLLFACLAAVCVYFIIYIYKFKSSWYGPSFWPPNWYAKGPLNKDQGTSY
eukprot:GILI01004420.1.p1 GENE.GILI01004420.1~~GILI01004420.1.p1  ORF type:complete len:367 (+),score=126.18 GILI01004420.1:61-1161(+)